MSLAGEGHTKRSTPVEDLLDEITVQIDRLDETTHGVVNVFQPAVAPPICRPEPKETLKDPVKQPRSPLFNRLFILKERIEGNCAVLSDLIARSEV